MLATDSRTSATDTTRRLNRKLFDRLARARGAETVDQKAALVGIHRSTLLRMRSETRPLDPSLNLAAQIAERLGTKIDRLFPPTKASA